MNSISRDDMHLQLLTALADITILDAAQRSKLAAYGILLLEANRRVNLTGAKDVAALMPHILDSLAVAPYVQTSLIDIGSGGGLPAIPLSILCGVPCTMIDAVGKKIAFLKRAVSELALDAQALIGRAETLAFDTTLRESAMTATARAVAVAPTVLEYTMPFLAIGGRAILQRGALDERERQATADAALMLGGRLIEEIALEGSRRLLVVLKEHSTPLRFPRRSGIPEKRPLCL